MYTRVDAKTLAAAEAEAAAEAPRKREEEEKEEEERRRREEEERERERARKPFELTQKQKDALDILTGSAREILLYGGSRAAKTFLLMYVIIVRACKYKSRHLVLRQRFAHVKQSIVYDTYPKVLDLAFPGVPLDINRQDWFARLPNDSEIWFGGLDDKNRTEKVLGREFSTIFFNEASQMMFSSYNMALTRLAEKNDLRKLALVDENPPSKGHWTYKKFIEHVDPRDGTPLDKNLIASMLLNPCDNLDNIDKEYIERLEGLPEAERNRFLHGLFNDSVEGALYSKDLQLAELELRIGEVKPLEGYGISAVFDIGVSDDTAIWIVQFLKDKILLLDYYQNNRMSLPEYLNVIFGIKGYRLHTMYLPHDAINKSWATGRSNREIAEDMGRRHGYRVSMLPRLSLYDGISNTRVLFEKCYFDKVKCADGLECLRNYKLEFSDKLGAYKENPVHDWASHGADAFRYVCMAYDTSDVAQTKKMSKEEEKLTFNGVMDIIARERREMEERYM